jgi:hypothetical protein
MAMPIVSLRRFGASSPLALLARCKPVLSRVGLYIGARQAIKTSIDLTTGFRRCGRARSDGGVQVVNLQLASQCCGTVIMLASPLPEFDTGADM